MSTPIFTSCAAEGQRVGVLELPAALRPDLIVAAAVGHRRERVLAREALADARRSFADVGPDFGAGRRDVVRRARVLEAEVVQLPRAAHPGVAEHHRPARRLLIVAGCRRGGAAAAVARRLLVLVRIAREERLRVGDLSVDAAEVQVAGERPRERPFERGVELGQRRCTRCRTRRSWSARPRRSSGSLSRTIGPPTLPPNWWRR